MAETTVAGYLKSRLEELGLEQLFGVAGNYTAPFLDTILEDAASPIRIVGVPNELVAGYACDGYARLKGIGAVAVTYGVGAFSLLNAVAGTSSPRRGRSWAWRRTRGSRPSRSSPTTPSSPR